MSRNVESQPGGFRLAAWSGAVLIATCGFTWLAAMLDLDIRISRWCFESGAGWMRGAQHPWYALYIAGPWPAVVLCGGAVVAGISAVIHRKAKRFHAALFLVLTALIGNVLLIETGLKGFMGRARPRDVTEFGGFAQSTPVGVVGSVSWNSSFPSGHAAAGFYLMAPALLLRKRYQRLLVQLVGWSAGCAIGLARMLQGAHFATDILWSFTIVYLTSLAVWYWSVQRPVVGESAWRIASEVLQRLPFSGVRGRDVVPDL